MVRKIPVKEFMQRPPEAARSDMLLTELVATLRRGGYRAMPVADNDGNVVGVISETDLFLKELTFPFSTQKAPSLLGEIINKEHLDEVTGLRETTVGQVMHASAVTVGEETTLEEAALLMCERRLAMVPVVHEGRLTGVVRRSDILALIYGEPDQPARRSR